MKLLRPCSNTDPQGACPADARRRRDSIFTKGLAGALDSVTARDSKAVGTTREDFRGGPVCRAAPRDGADRKARRARTLGGRPSPFHDETLPQEGAKTAHFTARRSPYLRRWCGRHFLVAPPSFGEDGCSMKITEDVRKYAADQSIAEDEALKKGMEEKSREFTEKGSELYAKA
jgi:hypothetical protein